MPQTAGNTSKGPGPRPPCPLCKSYMAKITQDGAAPIVTDYICLTCRRQFAAGARPKQFERALPSFVDDGRPPQRLR